MPSAASVCCGSAFQTHKHLDYGYLKSVSVFLELLIPQVNFDSILENVSCTPIVKLIGVQKLVFILSDVLFA